MTRKQSIGLTIAVAIVAIAAGALLSRALHARFTGPQAQLATATLLEPPRPLPDAAFRDHEGRAFDAARWRGRWHLLFFGFTSCPDVCPATLGVLAQAERQLSDLPAAQRPQVVLVSVDPQRDTPAQLAAYVKFFSPSFLGLSAPLPALEEFTRRMGVPIAQRALDGGGYTVDHSAAVFLVNPAGQLRALFSAPHATRLIAEDYRRIVALPGA